MSLLYGFVQCVEFLLLICCCRVMCVFELLLVHLAGYREAFASIISGNIIIAQANLTYATLPNLRGPPRAGAERLPLLATPTLLTLTFF